MDLAAILAALTAIAQIEPLVERIIPLVQKGFAVAAGTDSFNDADLLALQAANDAIDARVAAAEAATTGGTG